MHFFLTESDVQELLAMAPFKKRAQRTYEENLDAYIKLVLRRPFAKLFVCAMSSAFDVMSLNDNLGIF